MLWQSICRRLLHDRMGWTVRLTQPIPEKCVICVAPHTSNWDFVIGELYYGSLGRKANFLMKREWFFPPLGTLLRRIGGIPVSRGKRTSLTDQLAEHALRSDRFCLAVTPEGTRSKVTKWKRGFYYIALKAGLPILLFGIDYAKREIVCTRTLTPSGDAETDMREIMSYYAGFKGKHPEKFAVEEATQAN